ncbi:hypothetical protein LCGC14_0957120 [marine sediment metagenome]|uniref:Uncharacterized protein n=1 Tax=marine sediment metagenome TaxID=412755 RepID=A0A0F9NFL6_9ZZZZ
MDLKEIRRLLGNEFAFIYNEIDPRGYAPELHLSV